MNRAFEKILERLSNIHRVVKTDEDAEWNRAIYKSTEIVQEVAEEYNRDMKHNLAEMYAKNMVDYGVDVTKAWQTATQQSYALEKAYIRGRQYEVNRFNELRKEYNNGWIPYSDDSAKLPKENEKVRVTVWTGIEKIGFMQYGKWYVYSSEGVVEATVIAWQPTEPFKERD